MVFLFRIAVVQTSPETVVKIEPQTDSAKIGEEFSVNVTVENVQNLYGVEVTLYWNASFLQIANVDVRLGVESHPDGVLHEPIIIAENEVIQGQGKYILGATSWDSARSFNGSGNIVKITFNTVGKGNSTLSLETDLYDYPPPDRDPRVSLPIEHITVNGSVEIIPEFPNVTILFLFMVSTIVTFTISKRVLRRSPTSM